MIDFRYASYFIIEEKIFAKLGEKKQRWRIKQILVTMIVRKYLQILFVTSCHEWPILDSVLTDTAEDVFKR